MFKKSQKLVVDERSGNINPHKSVSEKSLSLNGDMNELRNSALYRIGII